MKSKKWARRRPCVIVLVSSNGWHKRCKIPRELYEMVERAAAVSGQTMEEFILEAIQVQVGKFLEEPSV